MEEEEDVTAGSWSPSPPYFSFSSSILVRASCSSGIVLGERFLPGVAKIGQQAEVQVFIAIGQKPDFQRLDQILDVRGAGQHRRHHHQRARVGGMPSESPSGQGMRRHQQVASQFTSATARLTGAAAAACRQAASSHPAHARRPAPAPAEPSEDHGDQRDPAQVQQQGKRACRPAPGLGAGRRTAAAARARASPCRSGRSRRARRDPQRRRQRVQRGAARASSTALRATSPSARRHFLAISSVAWR
jgi:hypothetical protein